MPGWDDLFGEIFWQRWAERAPLPITSHWMSELRECGAKRVYDMGCGLGRHTFTLAKLGLSVVASDTSPRARLLTAGRLSAAGLHAEVIDADMAEIPYPNAYFDGVLSLSVMEHNTRAGIVKTISEIHRVLRPGGQVLASFLPRTRRIPKDDPGYEMVEDNTLLSYGPEQSIHHMVDEAELRELFGSFVIRSIGLEGEAFEALRSQEFFITAEKEAH